MRSKNFYNAGAFSLIKLLEKFYSALKEIFAQALNTVNLVRLEGNKVVHIILPDAFGCFEEIFFKQIYFEPEIIRDADVVIDLGAHQGTFTIYSIINMKPCSVLISIEPNPRAYAILLENIHLYQHIILKKGLKVYAINKAIFTSKKLAKLKLTRWSESSHLSASGELIVQTITLDEVFSIFQCLKNPKVLLKMDIEGAEHELLRDKESLKFIGMCKYVAIEPHTDHSEIMEKLEGLGFKVKLRRITLEPTLYRMWLSYKPKLYTSIVATYRLIASSVARPRITIISAERW